MQDNHYLIPMQQQGKKKDLDYIIDSDTIENAEDWFIDAKERLLDVNGWHKYSSNISADLKLADAHGNPLSRHARKGDHLRMVLGAAGGYDWAVIVAIEYDDYPDEVKESFAMLIKPVEKPSGNNIEDVHTKDATSTLVIERNHKKLAATYHGRNEPGIVDEDMATGAWLGLSDVQWAALIKGFIEGSAA